MGRFIRGALVGFLFALTVGVWPAGASVSNVRVTSPTSNQVLAGTYATDGTPSGFGVNLRGTANASCGSGFSSIYFTIAGPKYPTKTFNVGSTSTNSWSGGPSTPWDTQPLLNGAYHVVIQVSENDGFLCTGQSTSAYVDAKLANPAQAPVWSGSPTPASNGSARVTLQWKKNTEPDVIEYHIYRSGPDGNKEAVVNAASPTGCSLSSNTYTCTDANFPSSYDGNYSYAIRAWRLRPAYNSTENPKTTCSTSDPCVVSQSNDVRQVTLTAPTPSPTPSPSGSPTGGPSTTPTPGSGPTLGFGPPLGPVSGGGPNVLSFGGGGGGSGVNPFYSGTYSETLPYTPKSVIVGNGTSPSDGKQADTGGVSGSPPNYRTIMLPVAGGLLAFLSAAHVRRLLVHF